MSKGKNILPDDDKLLKYIQGESLPGEAHHIEEKMLDSSFVNDAVEGLQSFNNKKKINALVEQLNTQLQKQTQDFKSRRNRRKIKDFQWIIVAVIIILALCILGYVVLHVMVKK